MSTTNAGDRGHLAVGIPLLAAGGTAHVAATLELGPGAVNVALGALTLGTLIIRTRKGDADHRQTAETLARIESRLDAYDTRLQTLEADSLATTPDAHPAAPEFLSGGAP